MSNLWTVTYAFRRCNLEKLSADILLRFQWQLERASFGLRLGPGFTSTSPLRNTKKLKKKTNKVNNVVKEKIWRKIQPKQGTTRCFLIHCLWEKIRHWTVTKIKISYWQKLRSMLYKCYLCSIFFISGSVISIFLYE